MGRGIRVTLVSLRKASRPGGDRVELIDAGSPRLRDRPQLRLRADAAEPNQITD